jgi:hypothetical protein
MHRAKVHHFRSRIAIPAPSRVNLPSGDRTKRLTFAPRCARSPGIALSPHNPLIFSVVAQILAQLRPSFWPSG